MGSPDLQRVTQSIENCLLPKLCRNFEECEIHAEYESRRKQFVQHFYELTKVMEETELKGSSQVIACLLILYKELQTTGMWSGIMFTENAKKLNAYFELTYDIKLDEVLKGGHELDNEAIFDKSMEYLHQKLTPEDFKKYPSLIEVYFLILKDLYDSKIKVNLKKTLPISLLLIDDYVPCNKTLGLKTCAFILQCPEPNVFNDGNYYDVIHSSLHQALTQQNLEDTILAIENLLMLLELLPDSVKEEKTDLTYAVTLNQILSEPNINRKVLLYCLTLKLIQMLGINCAKRRRFHEAIIDGINTCCNKDIQDDLLPAILRCLKEWIRQTWCVWDLRTDHRILAALMKLQCACKPQNSSKVVNVMATLITICTIEEQRSIVQCLRDPPRLSGSFSERVNAVYDRSSM